MLAQTRLESTKPAEAGFGEQLVGINCSALDEGYRGSR
jgi:hypothetical protein